MFSGLILAFVILFSSSGPQIEEAPYVVVYDIQDLLQQVPNYTDAPEIDLNAVLSGNGSPFTNVQPSQQNQKADPQKLMSLIQAFVAPDSWGDTATMTYWNGKIIVKAPKAIHDQIR